MLSFLFKKERHVEELIFKYLEMIKCTQDNFMLAFGTCFLNPYCENFDFYIQQTHKCESRADDLRGELVELLYGKALLPESRGDIMVLLDLVDEIPNLYEEVLFAVQLQRLFIPEFLQDQLKELLEHTTACCDLVVREVQSLFTKNESIKALVAEVDRKESRCDHIGRHIVMQIFESDLDPFVKLQLKELIGRIGGISNAADHASRRVHLISIKRRV